MRWRWCLKESTIVATGEVRYFQSIKKPLRSADGNLQILVIATDITEVRVAQLRAEESELQLKYAMEATGEGVWDWDLATGVVRHSARWAEVLGLDMACLAGNSVEEFSALLHPRAGHAGTGSLSGAPGAIPARAPHDPPRWPRNLGARPG